MKSWRLWALAAVLAASPALAEKARERDASSGSSGDTGSRHHSGAGATSRDNDNDAGSTASSPVVGGSGSATAVPRTDAERRHPRAGTGTGPRDKSGRVRYGHYGPHYHGSSYYPYSCYDSGYYDYGYYDAYGPRYPRYRYRYYDDSGAVRVLVDPQKTRVYVDGYYAGIADDFDGIFQRLYLPPGRHEITLKLDGHRTHRVMLYSVRGHTIKLHHDMARGTGEDEPEDMASDMEALDPNRRPYEDDADFEKGELGRLKLDVRPSDAAVYIDGELHRGDGDIRLPSGLHRIEVARPGYRTYERDFEIRDGKTVELDIELQR